MVAAALDTIDQPRYPKPPALFSLRTAEGWKQLGEAAMLSWLRDYISEQAKDSVFLVGPSSAESEAKLQYLPPWYGRLRGAHR